MKNNGRDPCHVAKCQILSSCPSFAERLHGSVESTHASEPETFYLNVSSTFYYNMSIWTRVHFLISTITKQRK